MSVAEIILSIVTTIFGSGLIISMITLRDLRRKAKAEADQATTSTQKGEVDLVGSSVNQMVEGINILMKQNKELISELAERHKERESLVYKIEQLDRKVSSMIKTNREVVKALEKLNIDPAIIEKLKGTE